MLNLEENELNKVTGCYTGKLFKVVDDFKYEVEAKTSLTFDDSNNLRLEIFMDGCGSGEMNLLTKEVNTDVFEVSCDDKDEHLSGKIDAYNKMLSFKVESPRSGETEFVGCL
ncbi:hypothetical protein [Flammeovirga pacifica]|uniref:Lipocalin-like domain-containing protein n=1 Tax=Flammeovirga pacifica TaxID=915059 RepID=A0A1S1YYK9_FLAPC|nr:hypothetical protein [Flammeovirga pacifica]OHX66080.1 hypothetical protein NH26_06815 [Flammeovirga pacifica]